MNRREQLYARHQALRWLRPDAARLLAPGTKLEDGFPALAVKYSQDQPRVPGGNGRESGRWMDGSYETQSEDEDSATGIDIAAGRGNAAECDMHTGETHLSVTA